MKVKNLMMVAAAFAAGASFADGTSYDSLVLTTNDWFSATASGSALTTAGGEWSTAPTVSDGKAQVLTLEDTPITLTANTVNANPQLMLYTYSLVASTVPSNLTYTAPSGKAPALGFAIKQKVDGSRACFAYTGSAWTELTALTVPTDKDTYTLVIQVDERDSTAQARFLIGSAATEWIAVGKRGASSSAYVDLYGDGAFTSLVGQYNTVQAEVIEIGDKGNVKIPEESLSKITVPSGTTTAAHLAAVNEVNGMSNLDNYILFGKGDAAAVTEDDKVEAAVDAVTTADHFALKLPKVNVPSEMASKVSYKLLGSSNGTDYTVITGVTWENGKFDIPLSKVGTYKYFKAQAVVDYSK